jgi:hypothetical protein
LFNKPTKFDGKIGDAVENWLEGWEMRFKHRKNQDGVMDKRSKIEIAMQNTVAKVAISLARYGQERREWKTWANFKKQIT